MRLTRELAYIQRTPRQRVLEVSHEMTYPMLYEASKISFIREMHGQQLTTERMGASLLWQPSLFLSTIQASDAVTVPPTRFTDLPKSLMCCDSSFTKR